MTVLLCTFYFCTEVKATQVNRTRVEQFITFYSTFLWCMINFSEWWSELNYIYVPGLYKQ